MRGLFPQVRLVLSFGVTCSLLKNSISSRFSVLMPCPLLRHVLKFYTRSQLASVFVAINVATLRAAATGSWWNFAQRAVAPVLCWSSLSSWRFGGRRSREVCTVQVPCTAATLSGCTRAPGLAGLPRGWKPGFPRGAPPPAVTLRNYMYIASGTAKARR